MGFLDRFAKKDKKAESVTAQPEKSAYRSVEVFADTETCCQAAKDIAGQRFLSASAPFLPLKNCGAANCRCSYKRYKDRRTDSRRSSDVAFDILSQYRDDEKRSQQPSGRREAD